MENIADVYREIIMEHSMNSSNKHKLFGKTCSVHGHNPNCGDDITLQLKIKNGKIKDMSFLGSGCAISQSSTSIMIDTLRGKTIEEAKQIVDIFVRLIDRQEISADEESLLREAIAFKNVSNMPARVKCALLAWKTLEQKLSEE